MSDKPNMAERGQAAVEDALATLARRLVEELGLEPDCLIIAATFSDDTAALRTGVGDHVGGSPERDRDIVGSTMAQALAAFAGATGFDAVVIEGAPSPDVLNRRPQG